MKLFEAINPIEFNPFSGDIPASLKKYLAHAELADLAYWEKHGGATEVQGRLILAGATEVHPIVGAPKVMGDDIASQALYFRYGGFQFIIIAGTNEVGDWLTNLDMKKESSINSGMLHNGFLHYAISIKRTVIDLLVTGVPIIIVGHSLGGAAAEILATDLAVEGFHVEQLTTFGAPRSADDVAAKLANRKIGGVYDRFVFGCDVVPKVPPEKFGFKHVVEAWQISPWGEFLRSDNRAALYRVGGRLDGIIHARWITKWGGARSAGIAHHYLGPSYIGKVRLRYKKLIEE